MMMIMYLLMTALMCFALVFAARLRTVNLKADYAFEYRCAGSREV
jgi:hypothetical protein